MNLKAMTILFLLLISSSQVTRADELPAVGGCVPDVTGVCNCVCKTGQIIVEFDCPLGCQAGDQYLIILPAELSLEDPNQQTIGCSSDSLIRIQASTEGCYTIRIRNLATEEEWPFECFRAVTVEGYDFRNEGPMSDENEAQYLVSPPSNEKPPTQLGAGFGDTENDSNFTQNVMELSFTVAPNQNDPDDECDAPICVFDIKREVKLRGYLSGELFEAQDWVSDDDSSEDEDNTPDPDGGKVFSFDAPGFTHLPAASLGAALESRSHFKEWVEFQRYDWGWEVCGPVVEWESISVIECLGGSIWVTNVSNGLSLIEEGHGSSLLSVYPW